MSALSLIPFFVLFAWILTVIAACCLGHFQDQIRKKENEVFAANMKADSAYEMLCRGYDDEFSISSFDQLISSLPKSIPRHYYPYVHSLIECREFCRAAQALNHDDDFDPEMTYTRINFDARRLLVGGREVVGWERNGMVILPIEYFRNR